MQKKRTFTVMAILIAVLVLGVGYATVSEITLDLNGTANIKANSDFSVIYDRNVAVVVSPNATVEDGNETHPVAAGAYTSDTAATMTVWLDSTYTEASAVYAVKNANPENGLSATLSADVTQISDASAAAYFGEIQADYYADSSCTTLLGTDKLNAGETAYLKVTVSLAKTPINDVTSATFSVTTTATPEEAD